MAHNLTVDTSATAGFPLNGYLTAKRISPAGAADTFTIAVGAFSGTPTVDALTYYQFTLHSQYDANADDVAYPSWIALTPSGTGAVSLNDLWAQSPFPPGDFNPGPAMRGDAAGMFDHNIDGTSVGKVWTVGADFKTLMAVPATQPSRMVFVAIVNAVVPGLADRYSGINGTVTLGTDRTMVQAVMPSGVAVKLISLTAQTTSSMVAGGTLTIAVEVNGADHGPLITIGASASAGVFSNATDYTIPANGLVDFRFANSAILSSASILSLALVAEVS